MDENKLKTGTTTLGMVCKDGVVLATEKRATMGTLIAHRTTQKLFKIDDHIGLTVAGLVGDAQVLARYLQAEVELYRLTRNSSISVFGASSLMANILNQRKFAPYWVQLIIGGIDKKGGHVFSLDAAGGSIEDVYTTTGSGSPYVFGILEDQFSPDIKVDEGVELAVRAISSAMRRDSASGDGISCSVITKKGFKEMSMDELKPLIDKYKH